MVSARSNSMRVGVLTRGSTQRALAKGGILFRSAHGCPRLVRIASSSSASGSPCRSLAYPAGRKAPRMKSRSPARRLAASASNVPSMVAMRRPGYLLTTPAMDSGRRRVRPSGSAPTVTVPCVMPRSAAMSATAWRISAKARFNRNASATPAGVGIMPRAVRSNSATPMLSSIWRTPILTAGCVMPRLSATDAMWCCSVSATNARTRRSGARCAHVAFRHARVVPGQGERARIR